ncbi:39S ribosomal protein L24, mitochondrial [Blastocladiella emersonii ATCC 22665]|nr:39S ribosomal protein L24, mitochondrial [Blastocladiella emersonii ATCC 22665]
MSKYHKMVSQPLWKLKGYNLIQPKVPKVQPKDVVKRWNIFMHDDVMVMSGANKGEKGKVINIDKSRNLVFVEGKKLIKKHIPITPQTPRGGTYPMESGIHVSNVALIDPKDGQPCSVRWERVEDPATGKLIRRRISKLSSLEIPRPKFDPSELEKKRIKDNKCDTLLEAAQEQTYFPTLASPPVPGDLRLKGHGLW